MLYWCLELCSFLILQDQFALYIDIDKYINNM